MHRYYRLARAAAQYVIPESWAWGHAEEVDELEYGCQVWTMAWQVAPGSNGFEYDIDVYDVILVIDTPDDWCGDSPDGVAIDHKEIATVRAADRHALGAYVADLYLQYDLDSIYEIDEIEEEIAAWLDVNSVECSWITGDTLGVA
jgi:hypothetical protein